MTGARSREAPTVNVQRLLLVLVLLVVSLLSFCEKGAGCVPHPRSHPLSSAYAATVTEYNTP